MAFVRLILWILGNAATLWIAVEFVPSVTFHGQPLDWIIAGIILGIANLLVKPVLKIVAGPFIVVTFGLGLIVVQSIVLWLTRLGLQATTGAQLVFDIPWGYIWASIIVGVANLLFGKLRNILTAPAPADHDIDDAALHERIASLDATVQELKRHHNRRSEHHDTDHFEEEDVEEWDDDLSEHAEDEDDEVWEDEDEEEHH